LERRRKILDAAVDVFGSSGYKQGTLQDIADRVGMTHAGVLHHFGSKDQLLVEVLAHRDKEDVMGLDGQRVPGGLDFFRHLVVTAFANVRRRGAVRAFAVLSAEALTADHPGHDYFFSRYHNLRQEAAEAFRTACADQGVQDPQTIDYAAASVLAVMDGLQIQWLLDPTAVDLAPATEFALEAIVAAVLAPQPSPLAR
jgi:AcrR family transcriptional regulator